MSCLAYLGSSLGRWQTGSTLPLTVKSRQIYCPRRPRDAACSCNPISASDWRPLRTEACKPSRFSLVSAASSVDHSVAAAAFSASDHLRDVDASGEELSYLENLWAFSGRSPVVSSFVLPLGDCCDSLHALLHLRMDSAARVDRRGTSSMATWMWQQPCFTPEDAHKKLR